MDMSTPQMDMQTAMMASNQLPRVHGRMDEVKARETAQDFEAFFLAQAFENMFKGIEAEEPFGGGHAEEMWRSMQVQEFGKEVARNGGVGIADAVFREIMKMQEVQGP